MVQRVAVLLSLLVLALAAAVGMGASGASGAGAGPALTVDASVPGRAISPRIYGMNDADPALAAEIELPAERWGGNDKERYNWRIATKNTGRDWFFENVADCFQAAGGCNATDRAADGRYRPMIARQKTLGGTAVMQLPLLGWVAKDDGLPAGHDHPFPCGFPIQPGEPQSSFDFWDPGCGNGRALPPAGTPVPDQPYAAGDELPAGPPERTSVPFGPADAKAWVQDLVQRYGDAAHGGVGYYELGNEPGLWDDSHRDVHPDPTTFDELRDKSVAMARAVKEADPTAKVIGFSEWGWTNYFCSALDVAPLGYGCDEEDLDRAAHGGAELSAWYLAELKQASTTAGKRLLDDFDLHYYNQGDPPKDAARALWDSTYVDQSWIGEPVWLLPRMRAWVDDNYPGTGISLSEYNLSNDLDDTHSVQATLLEAEALGIFAREGVDMAAMWAPPEATDRVADAFRLYRSYDGYGGRFGDAYLPSTSADQRDLAVYGARRTADGAVTVAVLNKTDAPLAAPLTVSGFAAAGAAQVWQWTGVGANRGISRQADQAVDGSAITFPRQSMTMLVLAPKGTDPPTTTPTTPEPPPGDPPPTPTVPTSTTPTIPTVTTPPPPPLARLVSTSATLKGRGIALRASCPKGKVRCGGTLTLRNGRATLATAKLSLTPGRTTAVTVRLARRPARTVAAFGRRGRVVKATVTAGKRVRTSTLRLRGR